MNYVVVLSIRFWFQDFIFRQINARSKVSENLVRGTVQSKSYSCCISNLADVVPEGRIWAKRDNIVNEFRPLLGLNRAQARHPFVHT